MSSSSKIANAFGVFAPMKGLQQKTGAPTMVALGAMLVLSALVFEVSELAVALLGGCVYLLVQGVIIAGKKRHVVKKIPEDEDTMVARKRFRPKPLAASNDLPRAPRSTPEPHKKQDKQDYRQASAAPIEAPKFNSTGLEAEVDELLGQLTPNAEADLVMKKLTEVVERVIWSFIPEAEVTCFASGNPTRSKAFGVAVPEVDIVINVNPVVLARRLQARLTKAGLSAARIDPRKLQKAALRAFTDELTSGGGLKFRRSAFRGEDPKVTLLAPADLAGNELPIPFDVSVNSATPLHSAALLMQCGQVDPRSKELILLVKRWARDRGVSHAAKGHLPPYAWSNLAAYFLQVGVEDGALLPPFDAFARQSCLAATSANESGKSAAVLFKEFVRFYHGSFEWRREAVSVRRGKRAAPDMSLPLHIVDADGSSLVAPSIEDPFVEGRNLSTCMTGLGVQRLREEFARADALLSRDSCDGCCSLTELLEPWTPPERDTSNFAQEQEQDQ